MLLCKRTDYLWYLVYVGYPLERSTPAAATRDPTMSKTASLGFAPSNTLFSRLFASIDRLLLAYAEAAIRNGDVSRCEV